MLSPSKQSSFLPYQRRSAATGGGSVSSMDVRIKRELKYLIRLTENIIDLYKSCNGRLKILDSRPQRILTNPSVPSQSNEGLDNTEGNLIVKVHDKIISANDAVYTVVDLLGVGTFGQVFRCYHEQTKEFVAIKVIKNIPAYHDQGLLEIKIVNTLNKSYDPANQRHIVRLIESFQYKSHICLVFELLNSSLLDVLTQNQYRGLPLTVIQKVARQLLVSLVTLQDANIIHCDLKPENILLSSKEVRHDSSHQQKPPHPLSQDASRSDSGASKAESTSPATGNIHSNASSSSSSSSSQGFLSDVKLIDFGSACLEGQTMFSYIQSRFYRAPEVLLGVPYNGAIDMWSFACVCVELYLGLPLFPGVSQHNQLTRITEMFGPPPDALIAMGKNSPKYFIKLPTSLDSSSNGRSTHSGVTTHSSNSNSSSSCSATSNAVGNSKSEVITSVASRYRIKTAEEYAKDTFTDVPVLKKYLRYSKLEDVIMKCTLPGKSRQWTTEQKQEEFIRRQSFLDFLLGMFQLHPLDRWTAKQAAGHPFITNAPFRSPYHPPVDNKAIERRQAFLVSQHQVETMKTKANSQMNTSPQSTSIPRPIQQQPQSVISQTQPHQQAQSFLQSHLSSLPDQHVTASTGSKDGVSGHVVAPAAAEVAFMPLDRRRQSESNIPLKMSYSFSESVPAPVAAAVNSTPAGSAAAVVASSFHDSSMRPVLKRGQAVLPRKNTAMDVDSSSLSAAAAANDINNTMNSTQTTASGLSSRSGGHHHEARPRYSGVFGIQAILEESSLLDHMVDSTAAAAAATTSNLGRHVDLSDSFGLNGQAGISQSYQPSREHSLQTVFQQQQQLADATAVYPPYTQQLNHIGSHENHYQSSNLGSRDDGMSFSQPHVSGAQWQYQRQPQPQPDASLYGNDSNQHYQYHEQYHYLQQQQQQQQQYQQSNQPQLHSYVAGNSYLSRHHQHPQHHSIYPHQTAASMVDTSGSHMPSMSYSVVGSGPIGGGSMQEGRNVSMLTDFGQALLRPDLDERRRLSSMTDGFVPPMSASGSFMAQSRLVGSQFTGTTMSNLGGGSSNSSGSSGGVMNGSSRHNAFSYAGAADGYMATYEQKLFTHSGSKNVQSHAFSSNVPTNVAAPTTSGLMRQSYVSGSAATTAAAGFSHHSASAFSYSMSASLMPASMSEMAPQQYAHHNLGTSYAESGMMTSLRQQQQIQQQQQHLVNHHHLPLEASHNNLHLQNHHSILENQSDQNATKLSRSFHGRRRSSHEEQDVSPLVSGKGFEYILEASAISPGSENTHDDDGSTSDLVLPETEMVADWDPFFVSDDISHGGQLTTDHGQRPRRGHLKRGPGSQPFQRDQLLAKDINQYL